MQNLKGKIQNCGANKYKKFLIFAFLILTFAFLAGCARTVTPIIAPGKFLVVEVTLRGKIDINNNRYFFVFSTLSNFQVPLPPPDNITYEFLEPGMTPQQGNIIDYYNNYYSTWSGFVLMDTGGVYIYPGPFIPGVAASRETLASLGDTNTTKISFSFRLDQIFSGTVPDKVYFDFVTVPWPTGGQKFAADHLNSTNAYISTIAGSIQTVQDEENLSLDAATDIISCTVSIQ